VINRTKSSLVNVRAELELCSLVPSPRGMSLKAMSIPLRRNELMHVAKFDPKDKSAEYALVFAADSDRVQHDSKDLGQLWAEWSSSGTSFLRFTVYCVHPVSGFGGIVYMDYHDMTSCVVDGRYVHGNDLTIQ
jgi:hypothetical protein